MNEPLTLPVSDRVARTIRQVAEAITAADALLVTAGAGMSADSGLPVFRGNEGFWRAYPPLAAQRISFERMAQPVWFDERPRMAWAFYGHRLQLYRDAVPHEGHALLRRWRATAPAGSFVVTSNVDGQFAKAGFPASAIAEHHGSIHRLQCSLPCSDDIWESTVADLDIDLDTIEARGELPTCPRCGRIARPNILMFNDGAWIDAFTRQQMGAFDAWRASVRDQRLVILEVGAGIAIPSIRHIGERTAQRARTTLIRINPDAREGEEAATAVPLPALQALTLIDAAMHSASSRRKPKTLRASSPKSVHYSDLSSGFSQVLTTDELQFAERQLCLVHWYLAQGRFAPLPVLRGIDLTGYSMRGRVVASSEQAPGSPRGGALLLVKDPRGELVSTVAFAWRPREGAYLWRLLYGNATTPVRPLDYPREPWIARRLEPAAGRNAAMLLTLSFVEYAIAVAWLGQH
jgi:NAD-dependent SIR2 family protein deacetylase